MTTFILELEGKLMTDDETTLKMIEEVDPAHTAKLDEIDARVWCFLKGYTFLYLEHFSSSGKAVKCFRYDDNGTCGLARSQIKYTRSRDALKAIRPEGWQFQIVWRTGEKGRPFGGRYGEVWKVCASGYLIDESHGKYGEMGCLTVDLGNHPLPTEELAELHAIIQAIAYERGKQ